MSGISFIPLFPYLAWPRPRATRKPVRPRQSDAGKQKTASTRGRSLRQKNAVPVLPEVL